MNTMRLILITIMGLVIFSCAPDKPQNQEGLPGQSSKNSAVEDILTDPTKGIGAVKSVTLNSPLEQDRISRGLAIYEMKCSACHRLDDKRVVGPGWKDITKNRKPEWIMNMITNVDVMLDQDPEAQKLLELCLMRMPNQNVSIGDARDLLEFMRQNDGEK
ncbi:MAG: cytochrome c [Cyclobacteriaceae bacterium]|nr:cytochrome c [Cyclobacteriaceae bacterium]